MSQGTQPNLRRESVDSAVVIHEIELTVFAGSEGRDRKTRFEQDSVIRHGLPIVAQAPDPSTSVIPENVNAAKFRDCASSVDRSPNDDRSIRAGIIVERPLKAGFVADGIHAGRADRSFHLVPAVIFPGSDHADFFPGALSHVPGIEEAGDRVETKPPRVSQAHGPDLCRGAGSKGRIILGDPVGFSVLLPVDIDAKHFPQECRRILSVPEWIVGRTAVTHSDVEHAVGAEGDSPAVMVGERLGDLENWTFAARIDLIVTGPETPFGDDGLKAGLSGGVVEIETTVFSKPWMKSEAKEAEFSSGLDPAGYVEKRARLELPVSNDADPPVLLHDEKSAAAVTGGVEAHGIPETPGDRFEPNVRNRSPLPRGGAGLESRGRGIERYEGQKREKQDSQG